MGLDKADFGVRTSGLKNPAVVLAGLILIALVLYRETVFSFVQLWTVYPDPTYQHGLPVVAVCVFLFCRRWTEVNRFVQMQPSFSATVLVLLASCTWLLASLAQVLIVQQVSLVLLVVLIIVSVVGFRTAWVFAFPVSLIIFALPVWEPLRPYLQRLTAHAATFLVNLTGIPAILEGTQISVPAGSFDIAPTCSGMAYLIVGTMAGALFCYVNRLRFRTAAWILAASAGVSFLANATRITTVVIAGQLTAMQHQFVLRDHSALGWGLFGFWILLFLLIASRLVGPADEVSSATSPQATRSLVTGNRVGSASILLTLGALVFGPVLVYAYQYDRSERGGQSLHIPAEIGGWRATPALRGDFRSVFQVPDLEYERLYRDDQGREVYLYVAEYAIQEQGKEAVSNVNTIYDERAWQAVATRGRYLGNNIAVQETRLRSRAKVEKLVWHWYYVHGYAVRNRYLAKALGAWSTLNMDPASAVVIVATDLYGSEEDSASSLLRFVTDSKPEIERAIDRARQRELSP
jgi:EpsI family protein